MCIGSISFLDSTLLLTSAFIPFLKIADGHSILRGTLSRRAILWRNRFSIASCVILPPQYTSWGVVFMTHTTFTLCFNACVFSCMTKSIFCRGKTTKRISRRVTSYRTAVLQLCFLTFFTFEVVAILSFHSIVGESNEPLPCLR